MSITTSVINNFNNTIRKLQTDEETFNKDITKIYKSIMNISDDIACYQIELKLSDLCKCRKKLFK